MNLEPVYLVAPAPSPRTQTRTGRSFAIVGWVAAFLLGTGSGALGALAVDAEPSTASERLAWALELQDADLEALVEHHESFCWVACEAADRRLSDGIRRLVTATLNDDPVVGARRHELASRLGYLVAVVPIEDDLRVLAANLRDLR